MLSNNVVLTVNITIILCITACTIFGISEDVEGWGYSYLLLLALMSNKDEDSKS